jgi:hypothetical protein
MALSLSCLLANSAYCEDKKQPQPSEGPKVVYEKKEMTKGEILAEIKDKLGSDEEAVGMIPELKAQKGVGGNTYYTFKGVKLDDMPKKDLAELLKRVDQVIVKIQTDRIQQQMESIRQSQNIPRVIAPLPSVTQPPRPATAPPSTPNAVLPPPAPPKNR